MTSHPSLNPLITVYGQGKDPASSLGPHWQQPGWSILDNHLLDVPDAREVRPEKFRGRSLLVGIFSKYKFLCANTDIRSVRRRPLRQPSPTSPGNHAQKSLPGRSLSISSDVELTAYVPWAISWDRGYRQDAVGWFKEGNGGGMGEWQGGGTDRISFGYLVG